MESSARLVTIKRNGDDGAHFPLSLSSCLFGRSIECDIRIQLPVVSKKHCKIQVKEQEAILYNFSSTNPTQVNGATIDEPVQLKHGDIITIIDRSFRYENLSHEDGHKSTEFPGKSLGQEPARRASRASFSADPDKSEGMSLKRRRVSFGGCLRPELFDENLPPNTPLKRGETPAKRKSLATHSPAVLKKIIKEPPKSPRQQESAGGTPTRANDQRRGSVRTSPASSGSKSLYQTDTPKKSGRKSNNLPAKRASISRGQHGILQMISSKRRSGASEANLIVKKSWADVVKLGAKQTQMKVVKHAPQKQMSKRQRRPTTPKKPTSNLHNQFSTGHANSPCTIVIGRTQIEKVSMPAQPYKMLSNLMLNRKMDFSEDLSGLTEMFKTPVKEKQQQMTDMGSILPNSENLPEKQFQATSSGGTPLPITSEILGENVPSSTQNAAKEPSDTYSASPTLKRRSIKNGSRVQTPKNVHNITHLEKKTPGSDTELLETASSVSRTRRSRQLRHTLEDSMNEKTEADLADGITGKHLRKTSLRGQEVDQQVQDCENSSQRCKENTKLKEGPEKTLAMRSSAREQKLAKDLIRSQMVTQTEVCAEELLNQEQGTTHNPEESMHTQSTPEGDGQEATKQKVDPAVNAAKVKCCLKTPDKKTQLLQGPAGLKETFETPNCRDELIEDYETKVPCKYPQLTAENTRTSAKARSSMSGKKADVKKELPALTKLVHVSGGARHSPKVPELEHGDIKALNKYESKMLTPTITRSRRSLRKTEEKPQLLEDLTGFQELFLSPVPGDKIIKMPSESPYSEPVRTPASTKRLSKMGRRVNVRELSVLEKESPSRAAGTPAPLQKENDTTVFMETPKQKLDFTGNSVRSKRRSRTPKIRAQPLEDLAGFPELFQTPVGASDPVTVGETTKMSRDSPQPEPVRTPASTKRLSKTGLRQLDVKEEFSTVGKRTKSPGRATGTPAAVQEETSTTVFMKTPRQKLDSTGNSTGHKQRSRTPKIRTQPLEDLAGFPELFQTPVGASDPVTVGETSKMSRESLQPEPVRTPKTKRPSKTGLVEVDVREELSADGKRTKSPGRKTRTPMAPVQEDNDATVFMETPRQKLDFTENSTGHKRRSRTPKIRTQPLEDLDSFQELFQTPVGASDPVTVGETTKMSLDSPQPEPVKTPASTKRLSKAGLVQTYVKEELSTVGKRTKSPGRATSTPTAPVPQEEGIKIIMETSNQKLESSENLTGLKRQPRTRKEKAKSLEDLTGFQQLFQTPDHGNGALVVGKTEEMSFNSPQPEPVITLKSIKRRSRASMVKIDVEEELLESKGHLQSGEATDTLQVPTDNRVIRALNQSAKRKLDPKAGMPSNKRPRHASKDKTPCQEDLSGFQQFFQTPGYAKDSLTIGETSKMLTKPPQSGPVRAQTSRKSLPKISLRKMDMTELPELWKQSPGRAPTAPVPENNRIKAVIETAKEKLETATDVTELTREPRTPKENIQPLEDLDGLQELFKTPGPSTDPLTGTKRTRMSLKSPQPRLVSTPQTSKKLAKTRLGKVGVIEMLSPLNVPRCTTGELVQMPSQPEDDGTGNKDVKESKKQTQGPSVSVSVSKRQRGPCKERSQSSEDLFGVQELFQTPASSKDPVTVGETKKISLESPQPGHIRTPASTKTLSKTGFRKADVKECHVPEKPTRQSRGRITRTPAPLQKENDTTVFMETPKQKLNFTGNSVRSKRRSQTPKIRAQPLEDLAGFPELFQTPVGASDPLTVGETTKMSRDSPQPEPVRTPASTKRLSKTGLRQLDVKEELSTVGKRTKSPGRATGTPAAVQEETSTTVFMKTPRQKLDSTGNSTGHKRRSRTPKIRTQPLEDLAGFPELFQTPVGASDPVTVGETSKMSRESLQPEPVRTPKTKRPSKTGLVEVDVREELSADGKRTKSPGRKTRTPMAPVQEDNDATVFMETPRQKLDFTENSTGHKRRSRTPKIRTQPLEDLDGFQELFQTPVGASDPVTVGESTKMSLESSEPGHTRTQANTKTLSKTGLGKVDVKEEPSTLGKQTASPGRATRTLRTPVQKENDATSFMETPKQKLDFTGNSVRSKRRSRTPKIRAQPLEDLAGFPELFQTPVGASDPVTVGETTKMSRDSPQPEPVKTPASTKRLSKMSHGKVDVKKELSPLNKPRCASQEFMHAPRLPVDDGRGAKDVKKSVAQTLDPPVHVTRSKRQQGACKKRSQSPEDLSGLQELFQTPGHDKISVAGNKPTKMSSRFLPLEPKDTSVTSQRQPKINLRNLVKNEVSGDRMLPQISGEILGSPRVPESEGRVIRTRKQPVKRKLDTAVSVPDSKRQRVARAEKAQTRGHLSGVQELYQDPGLSMDSVTVDKTTKMPNKSPEPVEMMLETQPGRRLRRLGVAEEPRVQRKTTRVVRETRNTQKKEPMGDSKGVKEFKESSMQKQDPAVSLTGKRNQPRTAKKTQPLEELISFQEETSVRMSCQSPQSEEKETSAASKRLFRTQLCKVDVKEEPTTQRKPPGRETRSTLKEPVGDAINVEEELKASTKRKIDLATSMPVNKRPRRVPREKAQSLELAGLKGPIQTPGHTEESVSDKRSTQMPCNFPQTEQVGSLQISPRRPRTRRGKVEVNEEPSVLKKTMPTSRQTMRSCKVPEIDDKGTEVSKESVKQKLDTEANVTGSRRRPRAQKDEVQPLEVLSDSKEITQISDHPEKLRHDTQMPDSGKPLRTCRRVLRTSKEEPMEMSVDTRELAASQIKSNTFLPPKRTSARDGSVSRARVLRSVTQKQEATDEKPVPKTQRSARSKRHVSPEPVKKRHLRIMSNKIEPVEEQISNFRKTEEKEDKGENSVTPDQKTPQSSRYRKKTNEKHLRPKIDGSAEKVGITKNEKTIKSSQETELQNPDDGAKKSTSRGRASGKRTCLKSRGQSEIPQPYASEEKTHEPDMEIVIKTQKERGVSGHSNVRSLRSKKAGATLDTELKPRVTRGAKKDAKVPKQDEDIVYTRKLRTRSHQNSENK
ncbi:proliferation marker protein Ki-67 isoform X2 [Meriones unguiculatus]|uniref:proliferation marker protein Ki-67 isoform X2 n=1 Tax=Meriones unguiculatus TaxID=10047 RepID=UPI00293EAAD5|nr:proliferation marker protein Ki-67 isoform X2 [Meriones unguiculatus]